MIKGRAGAGDVTVVAADVVAVNGLGKRYGRVQALDEVSLEVRRCEIFGLLGQTCACKTTLVKILLGMVAPTTGEATLLGCPAGTPAARRAVGYLPEDHRLPEYHTAPTLLDVYGGLQGLPRAARRQRANDLIDTLGLGRARGVRVRGYSKGMKQRLGLAQALLHRPDVLFLDEPTDGVDPVGRKQIRDLLLAERARGVTIFINSHLLGEVEQLCDRVALLRQGRVVRAGRVAELAAWKGTWLVEFASPPVAAATWSTGRLDPPDRDGRQRFHPRDTEVIAADDAIDAFVAEARDRGLSLRHLERERGTLEDVYLEFAATPATASETTP
ncbi:MAG: ABC transporter ATP-binding protein [Planctomycetaceae bacterium]